MVSSSAVYPEYAPQPFIEDTILAENKYCGMYGTNKIKAEEALLRREPNAYILRRPYIYGQMNNVYREAFVFDCALNDWVFYQPKDGQMKLQFFHIDDLCGFMDIIVEKKPEVHIFNVGNKDSISVNEWVELCYDVIGKTVVFENISDDIEQRKYFPFYDYEYYLDVTKQHEIMPDEIDIKEGLKEAADWYMSNQNAVMKKPLIEYIDCNL